MCLSESLSHFEMFIRSLPISKFPSKGSQHQFTFVGSLRQGSESRRKIVCLRRQSVGGLRNAASLHTCTVLTQTSAAPATTTRLYKDHTTACLISLLQQINVEMQLQEGGVVNMFRKKVLIENFSIKYFLQLYLIT